MSDKVNRSAATFKLLPEAIELLKKLSDKQLRSQGNMIEVLIFEAAKKEGFIK
jgi:hypothetical protein